MKWWENEPKLYGQLQKELEQFPFLDCDIEEGRVSVRGIWSVHGETSLIENYSIKIILPDDYPASVPSVYELEGKVPRIPDRHVNYDGSCCLFAPPERWEQWPLGSGIDVFLNGPLKSYFFSQAYYDREHTWPFGEWLHGIAGEVQYYFDRLEVRSIQELKRLMIMIDIKNPSKHWNCPCGSMRLYSSCHKKKMDKLINILPKDQWESLSKIVGSFHWLG